MMITTSKSNAITLFITFWKNGSSHSILATIPTVSYPFKTKIVITEFCAFCYTHLERMTQLSSECIFVNEIFNQFL